MDSSGGPFAGFEIFFIIPLVVCVLTALVLFVLLTIIEIKVVVRSFALTALAVLAMTLFVAYLAQRTASSPLFSQITWFISCAVLVVIGLVEWYKIGVSYARQQPTLLFRRLLLLIPPIAGMLFS